MLRAVQLAHTTDKMITKEVKHNGHHFKSPCWPALTWMVCESVLTLQWTPEV